MSKQLAAVERAPERPFGIYARISQEGDRTEDEVAEQLDIYEADCREWIERHDFDVGDDAVVRESDVSGTIAQADRGIHDLAERVIAGELAGIVTPNVERFGRDTIEGCIAWKKINDAGGRLVFVNDGLDSANPDHETYFQLRTVLAEDYIRRVKAQFQTRRVNAAERGVYLGGKPPAGYFKDWDDSGRLAPHPVLSGLIVEAFERRARGDTFASITRWLRGAGGEVEVPNPRHPKRRRPDEPDTVKPLARLTSNGVRAMLARPAYLGESERPRKKSEPQEFDRTGKPKTTTTIKNAHAPLVSVEQWESAQAAGGPRYRKNGRWSSQVRLAGLCYCQNGHRLKTGGSVKGRNPTYTCTHADCDKRVTINASRVDAWVEGLIQDAVVANEPHVTAVLAGDDAYQRALDGLTDAQQELDMYRTEVKISDVGAEGWLRDVQVRTAAVEAARAALKTTAKPNASRLVIPISEAVWAATPVEQRRKIVEATWARESHSRLVSKIVVRPVGQGKRVHVSERAELWFVGAETALDPVAVTPVGDPETLEVLARAHAR